ncbi:MAG: ATP-binding cassette domain-containing protein [Candidatus Hydrogenedens sp.]|nr:ATP-binding cassette domain-containing protein [Candidatus Hydrogenedens sp.]
MHAIATRGLTKVYKNLTKGNKRSLDELSIHIREGEVFGFLGHNGAGKTTTIKILCGLVRQSAGEASLFGIDVRDPASRAKLGYLPEQPYFYEYLTPRETIEFYGRLRGRTPQQRAEDWERLSLLLDLRDIAEQRIKGFSKGMRQRIGFAVALVGDPPLLILDEPMSGLDPVGRRSIRQLILRCRDEGKTLFFSSHVLGDVEQICDRVSILSRGKLVREGRIGQLLGEEPHGVEVVATGLNEVSRAPIAAAAREHRTHEGQDVFVFDEAAAAQEAARAILDSGAALESVTPLKQSLEEFFMKEHGATAAGAGA